MLQYWVLNWGILLSLSCGMISPYQRIDWYLYILIRSTVRDVLNTSMGRMIIWKLGHPGSNLSKSICYKFSSGMMVKRSEISHVSKDDMKLSVEIVDLWLHIYVSGTGPGFVHLGYLSIVYVTLIRLIVLYSRCRVNRSTNLSVFLYYVIFLFASTARLGFRIGAFPTCGVRPLYAVVHFASKDQLR